MEDNTMNVNVAEATEPTNGENVTKVKYSSAQLNKILNKAQSDYDAILARENKISTYDLTLGENAEDVKVPYDYKNTQEELDSIMFSMMKIKHALNIFNSTTQVPGFNMTIDTMLMWLPMQNKKLKKLSSMKDRLPKERVRGGYYSSDKNGPEYRYTNYDATEVAKDYEETSLMVANAQLALDQINSVEAIELA